MRNRLLTAAVTMCALLLAVDVALRIRGPEPLPLAHGQSEGNDVLIAAAQTQNEAFCFLYSKRTKQLLSYMSRNSGGLELRGIRSCVSDFNEKIIEYPRSDRTTSAHRMRELAERLAERDRQEEK